MIWNVSIEGKLWGKKMVWENKVHAMFHFVLIMKTDNKYPARVPYCLQNPLRWPKCIVLPNCFIDISEYVVISAKFSYLNVAFCSVLGSANLGCSGGYTWITIRMNTVINVLNWTAVISSLYRDKIVCGIRDNKCTITDISNILTQWIILIKSQIPNLKQGHLTQMMYPDQLVIYF